MIKVYYLKISDYAGFADNFWRHFVSKETWEKVLNYRNNGVRRTKLLGESMVRQLLAVFGTCKAGDYQFVKGIHGKPYVDGNSPLFFNISHSGDYIVCAISDHEIGIDIERKAKARMGVARRFFHPGEIDCLEEQSGDERDDLFFDYWVIKESFLKYTGSGLSFPLSAFEVRFVSDVVSIYKGRLQENVFIRSCPIPENYKCFICSGQSELPETFLFTQSFLGL